MVERAVKAIAEREAVAPAAVMSEHGKELQELTGLSLGVLREILTRKRAWKGDQLKLQGLKKEAAVSVMNAQMRVDENVLRVRQAEALGPVLAALLTAAGEPVELPAAEAQRRRNDGRKHLP